MKKFILMLACVASLGLLYAQPNPAQRKCAAPMEDFLFRNAMTGFSFMHQLPARDQAVRSFTAANCLNTAQTRRLAALYPNEFHRYDYVCYAADFVIDYPNYVQMGELFHDEQLRHRFYQYIGYNPAPAMLPNPLPGYTGRVGGPMFASNSEFAAIKHAVQNVSFDNQRAAMFRSAAGQRLFLVTQLREIADLFDFDNYRLDFAKQALANCYDLDNYYQIAGSFQFDSYRRDLNSYIGSHLAQYVWTAPVQTNYPAPGCGHYPSHQPPVVVYEPVPGYTGQVGALIPMSDGEFNSLLQFVQKENFDNRRFDAAKASIGSRGLTTAQVVCLAKLFDFDSHRLDFAKFAFNKVYDIDNYYIVANEFTFDSYKRQLLDYIG